MALQKSRKVQFTVKALLLATTIAAVVITIRPRGVLVVKIDANGIVQVDGTSVEKQQLSKLAKSKLRWHNVWLKELQVFVDSEPDTLSSAVFEVTDELSKIGIKKYTMRMLEPSQ